MFEMLAGALEFGPPAFVLALLGSALVCTFRGFRASWRLNGWQRIAIVASLLCVLAGGFWGNKIALEEAASRTSSQLDACVVMAMMSALSRQHMYSVTPPLSVPVMRRFCLLTVPT